MFHPSNCLQIRLRLFLNILYKFEIFRAAAKSIHRLLKPGGQAFLLLVVNSGIYLVWDTIAKSKKWKKYFKVSDLIFCIYLKSQPLVLAIFIYKIFCLAPI